MIKRRSPYGLQMSMGSLITPLATNALTNSEQSGKKLDETWLQWWQASSAEQFYVDDVFILRAPEFHQTQKINPTY
jgi:hypothetical protein